MLRETKPLYKNMIPLPICNTGICWKQVEQLNLCDGFKAEKVRKYSILFTLTRMVTEEITVWPPLAISSD